MRIPFFELFIAHTRTTTHIPTSCVWFGFRKVPHMNESRFKGESCSRVTSGSGPTANGTASGFASGRARLTSDPRTRLTLETRLIHVRHLFYRNHSMKETAQSVGYPEESGVSLSSGRPPWYIYTYICT